jgi:hypothetical protein
MIHFFGGFFPALARAMATAWAVGLPSAFNVPMFLATVFGDDPGFSGMMGLSMGGHDLPELPRDRIICVESVREPMAPLAQYD